MAITVKTMSTFPSVAKLMRGLGGGSPPILKQCCFAGQTVNSNIFSQGKTLTNVKQQEKLSEQTFSKLKIIKNLLR